MTSEDSGEDDLPVAQELEPMSIEDTLMAGHRSLPAPSSGSGDGYYYLMTPEFLDRGAGYVTSRRYAGRGHAGHAQMKRGTMRQRSARSPREELLGHKRDIR